VENLKSGTVVPLPTKEGIVRPLTQIKDPEEQREVYQKAVETALDGKVTAQVIQKIINGRKPKKPRAKKVKGKHKYPPICFDT
jgi:hypothetical protein